MSQVCFHLISSNNFAGIHSLHVLKIHVLQYFILKCTSGQKSTDHSTSYIGWENFDSSDLESVTTTTSEQPQSRPVFLHTKKTGLPGYLPSRAQIFPPGLYATLSLKNKNFKATIVAMMERFTDVSMKLFIWTLCSKVHIDFVSLKTLRFIIPEDK